MKKIVCLFKRKASLTHAEFRAYYEASHVKLAHKHLGAFMADYRRNYIQDVFGIPTEDLAGGVSGFDYDCVTEIWFNSDEDYQEWMRAVGDPVIGGEFIEDEHNFIDRESFIMTICDEVSSPAEVLKND